MRDIYPICVEMDLLFMQYDTQSTNALFSILSTNTIGKSQPANSWVHIIHQRWTAGIWVIALLQMSEQIVQKVHMKWVITYEMCSFFSFTRGHLSLRQDTKGKNIVFSRTGQFWDFGLYGFS